jgi:hypothetical protein
MSHKDLVLEVLKREQSFRADEVTRYMMAARRNVASKEQVAAKRQGLEEVESAIRWVVALHTE